MNKILNTMYDLRPNLCYNKYKLVVYDVHMYHCISHIKSQTDLFIVSLLHHDTLDNVHLCDKCTFILCNENSYIIFNHFLFHNQFI